MLWGVCIGVGSFLASYSVGWLFLSWTFLHKYDESDAVLQVMSWTDLSHRGNAAATPRHVARC